jgi:hypothetical protein
MAPSTRERDADASHLGVGLGGVGGGAVCSAKWFTPAERPEDALGALGLNGFLA